MDLERELADARAELAEARAALEEAREQQTATSEILKSMTRSTFDLEPLLATIIENAGRISGAEQGAVHRFDGAFLHLGASYRGTPDYLAYARSHPVRADQGSASGRAVLERRTIHIPDVLADPAYHMSERQRVSGFRTFLAAPMLRDHTVVGVINLWKTRVEPFTKQQIDMLETFAAQAVIAIENVRLVSGLTETLAQQTAIAEILRVINRSAKDVGPVLEAILDGTLRLCEGLLATVYRLDGDTIHLVASRNMSEEARGELHRSTALRLSRSESLLPRVMLDREIVNVADAQDDPGLPEITRRVARAGAYRSLLLVPMIREDACIGAIGVSRAAAGQFADHHVALLKTFADQAAVAIENARLFGELQTRTQALSRSVDELRALAQISETVSSTLELETVLTSIVAHAVSLTASDAGAIYEFDERAEEFHLRVTHATSGELTDALRVAPPRLGEGALGRAGAFRAPVQVPDLLVEGAADPRIGELLVRAGFRALLCVPLIREDRIVGGLIVRRRAPGEFAPETVALLETFAGQSALALQNARLFREIADKGRELEIASRHKSQFLANMSHELRTPLNAIIGYTELMLEDERSADETDILEKVLRASRHLLNLINDVLDLAKIEAGRMDLDVSDLDVRFAIDSAVTLIRERASRKGLNLTEDVAPEVGVIRGDERKIKQVLLNLLSNAVKFTPEGGRIDVRARRADGAIEIAVADTGVGIAPADREAVFDEFRQVGQPGAASEGTGLGLALCRGFIELHGGRIRVDSEVGAGSTFTFTLPA